jgi:hypothetical protein
MNLNWFHNHSDFQTETDTHTQVMIPSTDLGSMPGAVPQLEMKLTPELVLN